MGYNPNFLEGIMLPLPTYSLPLSSELHERGRIFDYPTYSVVMNSSSDKRSPVIVCLNIDQGLLKSTQRINNWRIDPRIGSNNQLDNDYYRDNDWDRGHMARRESAAWGLSDREAQRASDETFFYSNSCLQHANLNQDEWLELENWVLKLNLDLDGKITSFTGPIYGTNDRTVRPDGRPLALVPSGFFNVVCFINKATKKLDVRAFVMYQDADALRDKDGKRVYNNQNYQVTIAEIERLTGLQFDDQIYEANPLYYSDRNRTPDMVENVRSFPERIEVSSPEDIISRGDRRQTVKDDIVDIYISAAMIQPKSGAQWISLLNLGDTTEDLSTWEIRDNGVGRVRIGDLLTNPVERMLRPGQAVVVENPGQLEFKKTSGVIKLYDAEGSRIDWVNYSKHMVHEGKPVLFLTPTNFLE